MRPITLNIILLISFTCASAQEIKVEDRYEEFYGIKPAGYFTLRGQSNLEDVALGIEAGLISKGRNLSIFGTFDVRPFRKRILEYKGNNLFYQYQEERYFTGVGAEYLRRFNEGRLGTFLQVNAQYTWGAYGGTEQKPANGWIVTPRLGAFWDAGGTTYIKLGYAYLDAKTSKLDRHRVYLAATGLLTRKR